MSGEIDVSSTEATTGVSRRAAIGKMAVAGAAVWSVPLIVSSRAHATGSAEPAAQGDVQCLTLTFREGQWINTFNAPEPGWYDDEIEKLHVAQVVNGAAIVDEIPLTEGTRVEVCAPHALRITFVPLGGPEGAAPGTDDEGTPDTTEAPAPETTAAPNPETTEAPDTTIAPETTPAPETTVAPETTTAPETTPAPETTAAPTPETTEAPDTTIAPETTEQVVDTAPVTIQFNWSSSSPVVEGDLVGPFEVTEVLHAET